MLGARITFRLTQDLFTAIEKEAVRRGLVTPRGRPNISTALTYILRDWMKNRPKDKP